MIMKYLPYLLLIIGLYGCKSKQAISPEKPVYQVSLKKSPSQTFDCKDIYPLREIQATEPFAKTNIINYSINQSCVCVKFSYSGCNEGNVKMIYQVLENKSKQPEVYTDIIVKGAGLCEALLTDSICFDLRELESIGNRIVLFTGENSKGSILSFQY